ncbi:hypothetical protein AcV7_004212 [Taiwanofungus camphoratus]|nr:hypothetical protein AcV7_004212 [Antrodia cinnamomea]
MSEAPNPPDVRDVNNGRPGFMECLTESAIKQGLQGGTPSLDLPLVIVEHRKAGEGPERSKVQLRMNLTAACRFLEALGITEHLVYGVLTDGPIANLWSAWVKEGVVHIFERHTQKFDISTPFGAYHYATVLIRIAVQDSKKLAAKFAQVKDALIERLQNDELDKGLRWTLEHQLQELETAMAKRSTTEPGRDPEEQE